MATNKDIIEQLIERRDDESDAAYAAFLHFASLPISERAHEISNVKISEHTGVTPITVQQFRARYGWSDRISLIDAHSFTLEYEQKQKILSENNEKSIKENLELKTEVHKATKKMLRVANNLLDKAEISEEVIEDDFVITEDGRRVATTKTYIMKAKVSDIRGLVQTAVQASRLVEGLPTAIVETTGIIDPDKLQGLSMKELQAQIEREDTEIATRQGNHKLKLVGGTG